jgi:hypothetical protein
MQRPTPNRVSRIAAALVIAGLLAPAAGRADGAQPADQAAPVERHWYDSAARNADAGVDLLVVRPLGLVTLVAGTVLFVPAVIMTAPNGTESMHEAYDRFVREPGEYFYSRPLGEF